MKELEYETFKRIANELIYSFPFTDTKNYLQHGTITTYDHCISVAYYSYLLSLRLHLDCDHKSLIRGALLHDLYLYDWHEKDDTHKWHGFHHADTAHDNAIYHYKINELEKHIIKTHMWPLTIRKFPNKKESFIVCFVDTGISLLETFHIQIKRKI